MRRESFALNTVVRKHSWGSLPAILIFLVAGVTLIPALGGDNAQGTKPVLYVIGTAHLDSQWNWTVQDTIRQYIAPTFLDNFKLFECRTRGVPKLLYPATSF